MRTSIVAGAMIAAGLAAGPAGAQALATPEAVVAGFIADVRSGKAPERAADYMAPTVIAHQMNAENTTRVERTPDQYADHVREFVAAFGNFDFEVTEQLAAGDKVYVRWQQDGRHVASLDGEEPTGRPLREIASAVYRVEDGKIVEYWIQIDRYGFDRQLQNIKAATGAAGVAQ